MNFCIPYMIGVFGGITLGRAMERERCRRMCGIDPYHYKPTLNAADTATAMGSSSTITSSASISDSSSNSSS